MTQIEKLVAEQRRGFWSDNAASVHPAVMEALSAANANHAASYGDDALTGAACRAFDLLFEKPVSTCFVFNGTGANCVALALGARGSFDAVICSDVAHIATDECGAPEHLTGMKLMPLPTTDGKLSPAQVKEQLAVLGNMHHAQPRLLSITQCTELGTVYTPEEIQALCEVAHAGGQLVHMDGARIANAVAGLGVSISEMTWRAGVDLLSFGGTKNGLMFGEAVIAFDPERAGLLPFVRKNNGQLASKMRFVAAQYLALLEGDLWLKNARHANGLARALGERLQEAGLAPAYPVQCNEVFVRLPEAVSGALSETQDFHLMNEAEGLARFVLSWDSQEQDVLALVKDLREALG